MTREEQRRECSPFGYRSFGEFRIVYKVEDIDA